MLLSGYASDSDSETEEVSSIPKAPASAVSTAKPSTSTTNNTGPTAGPSKPKKRSGPIKITLDLPKVTGGYDDGDNDEVDVEDSRGNTVDGGDEARESKRFKGIKGGKGSSSLLGMLPAPKRKLPVAAGGDRKSSLMVNRSMASGSGLASGSGSASGSGQGSRSGSALGVISSVGGARSGVQDEGEEGVEVGGGKGKRREVEEGLDIFGLTQIIPNPSSTEIPLTHPDTSSTAPNPTTRAPPPLSITSAPSVSSFTPPEPTPQDAYPGYYQLPSGQWAAYDPEYYHSFFPEDQNSTATATATSDKRKATQDGRVGRGWADLSSSTTDILDVRADTGLAEARAEEERRARTSKPKLPGDDFVYQPIGQTKGVAADRHQLSSLLNTAFTQREALEERISQNKKSARMARTKYGF